MKFKFFNVLFVLAIILISGLANASLITHNGYTLNTETNIVSDSDYEFLQWSITKGQSINEALQKYGGDGWSLVSHSLMSEVFSDFGFESSLGAHIEAMTVGSYTADSDETRFDEFLELFGPTFSHLAPRYGVGLDTYTGTQATYDVGIVNTTQYSLASVVSDFTVDGREFDYRARDSGNFSNTDRNQKHGPTGIALMRTRLAAPVPEPTTASILALGLISLVSRRFKK